MLLIKAYGPCVRRLAVRRARRDEEGDFPVELAVVAVPFQRHLTSLFTRVSTPLNSSIHSRQLETCGAWYLQ